MLNINGLSEDIVLDHIKVGKSLDICYRLGLNKLDSQIAIIKNAHSQKMERKGIVKMEGDVLDRIDLDVLGYIGHSIMVSIVRDSRIVEERILRLPEQITNMTHYKSPRCVTSIKQKLPHIFHPSDPEREIYHCCYCDERYTDKMR